LSGINIKEIDILRYLIPVLFLFSFSYVAIYMNIMHKFNYLKKLINVTFRSNFEEKKYIYISTLYISPTQNKLHII